MNHFIPQEIGYLSAQGALRWHSPERKMDREKYYVHTADDDAMLNP